MTNPATLQGLLDNSSVADASRVSESIREPPRSIQLGLWAPTLREQGFDLLLPPERVDHFMQDDAAISRLHIRGLIPYSVHIKAREKLCKAIKAEIAESSQHPSDTQEARGEARATEQKPDAGEMDGGER